MELRRRTEPSDGDTQNVVAERGLEERVRPGAPIDHVAVDGGVQEQFAGANFQQPAGERHSWVQRIRHQAASTARRRELAQAFERLVLAHAEGLQCEAAQAILQDVGGHLGSRQDRPHTGMLLMSR